VTGRSGRAGKRVYSVLVVDHDKIKWIMRQKSDNLDVQAMGMFLMGSYVASVQVECNNIGSAGCDRRRAWSRCCPYGGVRVAC
jgi:hypothetical protein